MKTLRALSALLLASLVLLSSTSFVVGLHYCMGKVDSVSLSANVERCAKASLPACHKHQSDCCQDETISHDGDDFKLTHVNFNTESTAIITIAPVVLVSEIIPAVKLKTFYFRLDDHPLVTEDLHIALQVFRI